VRCNREVAEARAERPPLLFPVVTRDNIKSRFVDELLALHAEPAAATAARGIGADGRSASTRRSGP
jgi:hypothetical protein